MLKVISFSLFGNNSLYYNGIIKNIELAKKIYPDWICYVYYSDDVPKNIINIISEHENCKVFLEKRNDFYDGLFWRFKPCWDEKVEICCPRDCDSRLSLREKKAVDEWLELDKPLHIMRDAANHCYEIMAGMFGINKRCSIKNFPIYPNKDQINYKDKSCDQIWLTKYIWPLFLDDHVYHDYWYKNTNIFDKIEDEPHLYDNGIHNWIINKDNIFPHLYNNKSIHKYFSDESESQLFVGQQWVINDKNVDKIYITNDVIYEYRIRGKAIKYNYSSDKVFYVTDNTLKLTPHTFFSNGGMHELDEIIYFYKRVLENKKDNIVIVDIGSQTGLYTLYAKFLKNVTIYAYEPYTPCYNELNENIDLNNIKNVKTFNIAISNKKETKILKVPDHKGLCTLGDTPLRFLIHDSYEVKCDTLDNLFYLTDTPVDFIKCDTEGWEYYILQGGMETIKKYKPIIQLEFVITNMKQCDVTVEMFNSKIEELGYINTYYSNEEYIYEFKK